MGKVVENTIRRVGNRLVDEGRRRCKGEKSSFFFLVYLVNYTACVYHSITKCQRHRVPEKTRPGSLYRNS
jgi:hypothetical protein